MDTLKLRTWVAAITVLLAIIFVAPNFIDTSKITWWPAKKLNYGLDIQGGVHLVMGADVNSVVRTTVQRTVKGLEAELAKENIVLKSSNIDKATDGSFTLLPQAAADVKKIEEVINKNHASQLQIVSSSPEKIDLKYYDAYLIDQKQNTIRQAIETIRNRIDEFGVAEPSITQQGEDRILVQLPGMADAERAKQLINTTAKLDFMIVSREKSPDELRKLIEEAEKAGNYSLKTMKYTEYVNRLNADLAGKIPAKSVVYFEKMNNATSMDVGSVPFLLHTDTDLTGEALDSAAVSFDQYGKPEVALRFNPSGSGRFAEITEKNVGNQMAVVLDKVIKTAPNINTKISGGNAVITLGSQSDREAQLNEAKLISTALRAGALPVSLEQLEERRVGPSLGKDALHRAAMGAVVGSTIIIILMLVLYKGMGIITATTLVLNVIFIFAVLGSLGATLTLPGIAGMALTVGFAVDANVLINERIKEEFRKGSSINTAIQEGYDKAMSAIIDSNVTTAATAMVLLYFGTGPVRGFAVTLLAGIATTLFANVFVSKVIVDNLVYRFGFKKLSV